MDIDRKGSMIKEFYHDLKKLTPDISARRFNIRGGVDTTPAGTIKNINNISDNVNVFFNSLMDRGAIEMYRNHSEINNHEIKYQDTLFDLEKMTESLRSEQEYIKSSNLNFIQNEKNTDFYKNLISQNKTQTKENTMENQITETNQSLTPTEYMLEKINTAGIKVHLSKAEMKAILDAGKEVQKMAVKYGTNQFLSNDNVLENYGTYVVSVDEV